MGLQNDCKMPCPKESRSQQCPLTICQLSSPYLASDPGVYVTALTELPAGPIVSPVLWVSVDIAESVRDQDAAPPGLLGPLFLRTHSLPI
jgi:hypothetical protein